MNLEWHPFRAKAPMTFSADEYLETGELGLGVLIGFLEVLKVHGGNMRYFQALDFFGFFCF